MNHILETIAHQLGLPVALVLAFSAVAFSTCGVLLAASNRALALKIADVTGLIAGLILTTVAFLHLVPEAMNEGIYSYIGIATGVLIAWGLSKSSERSTAKPLQAVLFTSLLAIGIHSFLDGAVYVVAVDHHHHHHHDHGAATGLGLILHEGPEGVLVFALCAQLFQRLINIVGLSLVVSGLSTPLGTVTTMALGDTLGAAFLQNAFPVAAGLVLFAGLNLVASFIKRTLLAPTE